MYPTCVCKVRPHCGGPLKMEHWWLFMKRFQIIPQTGSSKLLWLTHFIARHYLKNAHHIRLLYMLMKKSIKHTRFYSERYGFGVRVHILLAQVPDAVYSLSSLVSQHTIQMTDSIKNPSIDFRILLLSQLPLPAPAQSILQRDYIDSGKGDAIQWSMSASAVWRWESWRLLLWKGDICVCLHVNSGHQGCSLYGFLWLCIVCEACVRGWHAWPQGAEGQTLIIRYRGATGLSPLVGGRLLWWGYRERERLRALPIPMMVGRRESSCFFND